jgi:hypothetical protein
MLINLYQMPFMLFPVPYIWGIYVLFIKDITKSSTSIAESKSVTPIIEVTLQ